MRIKTCDFVNLNAMGDINVYSGASVRPEAVLMIKAEAVESTNLKFGADPEGEMMIGTRIVNANENLMPSHRSTLTQIGTDGRSDTLEFRPSPQSTGEALCDEMARLIGEFRNAYPSGGISVKGDTKPLGCHLHVGTGFKTTCPNGLVDMYYEFLERPLWGLNGGARSSYATHKSIRVQPHGFEYRSLPAGVLANKTLAKIVMKVFANITKYYVDNAVVEFDSPVSDSDYQRIAGLTTEEIATFKRMANAGVPNGNIIAYWIESNQVVVEGFGTISFRDDWDATVKAKVMDDIQAYMKKKGNKLNVVFYGLSSHRGSASTIPMGRTIPIRRLTSDERRAMGFVEVIGDQLLIGLPYNLRMNVEGFADMWLEQALTYIRNRIKDVGDELGLTKLSQTQTTQTATQQNGQQVA